MLPSHSLHAIHRPASIPRSYTAAPKFLHNDYADWAGRALWVPRVALFRVLWTLSTRKLEDPRVECSQKTPGVGNLAAPALVTPCIPSQSCMKVSRAQHINILHGKSKGGAQTGCPKKKERQKRRFVVGSPPPLEFPFPAPLIRRSLLAFTKQRLRAGRELPSEERI